MKTHRRLVLSVFVAVACFSNSRLSAQEFSKTLIENPVDALVDNDSNLVEKPEVAPPKVFDLSKGRIEAPTENLIAVLNAVQAPKLKANDNPKCEPGLVSWHSDFDTACDASKASSKPVLLFQLLGQLDQRFT